MTGANVVFAFNDVWLRRIADDLGLLPALWARAALFLVLMLLVTNGAGRRAALATPRPGLQFVRALCPLAGSVLMLAAMGMIPVADATAMFFLSPLLASLLAMRVLHERMDAARACALALGLAGMLVIVQPGRGPLAWGHVLALACAGVIAGYQIFTVFVTRHAAARVTLLWMAATATALLSLALPFAWRAPTSLQWLELAATALLYALGHGMYIAAHARAEATRLAPLVYAQMFGTVGAGLLFYGQTPQFDTLAGAALIAGGGCIVLLRRRRTPS